MTILYSKSSTTIDNLVQEFGAPMSMMHLGAFRKQADYCPHCEHKMDWMQWLSEAFVVEIALIADLKYGPIVSPEEAAVVICECPKCGKKNVYHYPLSILAEQDFINQEKIEAEIARRGLKASGFSDKTELDKLAARSTAEVRLAQRVAEAQASLSLGIDDDVPDYIPDFELPCDGQTVVLGKDGYDSGKRKPCTVVWTKKNTNPRWRTSDYLVARCPGCGLQKPIQDELYKRGLL